MTGSSQGTLFFRIAVALIVSWASAPPALNPVRAAQNAIGELPDDMDASVATGFYSCSPSECSSLSELSVVEQFRHLGECLSGPLDNRVAGCACADLIEDGHVTLRDFAEFQNFPMQLCERPLELLQGSGLGYCPIPGTIGRASIIPELNGSLVLIGTLVFEGDAEVDHCLPDYWNDCYVEIPFRARAMTEGEADTLAGLLEEIPAQCDVGCPGPSGDWWCCMIFDPCRILYLVYDSRIVNDYCYGCGNSDAYRAAIKSVLDYLTALATENERTRMDWNRSPRD